MMKSTLCSLKFYRIMFVILFYFMITVAHAKRYNACSIEFSLIGSKCYYFSKEARNWSDAYYQCLGKNSSLAILENFTEDKLLRCYMRRHSRKLHQTSRWIGLKYDWKNKKWIWAETGQALHYIPESGIQTHEDANTLEWTCGELNGFLGNKWSYKSCLQKNPYICEKAPRYKVGSKKNFHDCQTNAPISFQRRKYQTPVRYNRRNTNSSIPSPMIQTSRPTSTNIKEYVCPSNMLVIKNRCYYFSHNKHNWNDAYWACRDNKSYLAIIHNKVQDKLLREFLSSGLVGKYERWIGGVYDWKQKKWMWTNSRKPMKYQGFASKMSTAKLEWRSIIVDPKINYRWNSRLRIDRKHYICQRRAKTIAKVEEFDAGKYSISGESLNSDQSLDSNQVPLN